MCIPLAVAALATNVAGVGLSAYGQYKAGKAGKKQAQMDAANAEEQARLSEENAGMIEMYGGINRDLTLAVAGLNNKMTQAVADTNLALINGTTDFNIGITRATTEFNASSAEGAAALLEAQGELQAGVHRTNADYMELQAGDALEAGNQAERQSRQSYAQLKGAQRARLAANGVALDEGSALRIQADTDYTSDVDADVIKSNALKAAFGYRVGAINERATADMASLDGKAQGIQKRAEAVATRINGAVSIAQAEMNRGVDVLNTKMTASVQILQTSTEAQIAALNIEQETTQGAWSARAAAKSYQGQAAASRAQAKSISPLLMAGTTLVKGAASVAAQAYDLKKSGAFDTSLTRDIRRTAAANPGLF